jgi:endonuclease/exonuclease/phosphatase family metal-dependent hydrolase
MYYKLRHWQQADRVRTIDRLLELRQSLAKAIPPRTVRDTLLLATWNLRDFDSNKFGHGPRLPETFYYIAEIISAFDLVALQEVNRDLTALHTLMDILGPSWDYIATDITEGSSGNNERMAFVFDKGKVWFQNIAGEIVLPRDMLIGENQQFARTPFVVKFQSGWFKFDLCTVHLYYGSESGEGYQRRVEEIGKIASFLAKRAKDEQSNIILLGDMNIVSPEDDTMKALKQYDFLVPADLTLPTNMLRNKYYDQIAFLNKRDQLELGKSANHAGVFEFYNAVFRDGDHSAYYPFAKDYGQWPEDPAEQEKYFHKQWRTWQMSDHLPLWVELKIDFTEKYLERIKAQA